jgi:hypothetical protein
MLYSPIFSLLSAYLHLPTCFTVQSSVNSAYLHLPTCFTVLSSVYSPHIYISLHALQSHLQSTLRIFTPPYMLHSPIFCPLCIFTNPYMLLSTIFCPISAYLHLPTCFTVPSSVYSPHIYISLHVLQSHLQSTLRIFTSPYVRYSPIFSPLSAYLHLPTCFTVPSSVYSPHIYTCIQFW